MFTPSPYQQAIFEFVKSGTGHGIVQAVAGSGKTTTNIQALDYVDPLMDVVFLAFNKHIADELKSRGVDCASTFHSLGKANITAAYPRSKFNQYKASDLLKRVENTLLDEVKNSILKLLSLIKANLVEATPEHIDALADTFDIDIEGNEATIHRCTRELLEATRNDITTYDFDDMIYWPAVGKVGCKKFDFIFVDECLPYLTPVLLADGTSLSIGEIVENKLDVTVLSYNTQTGKQEHCKVIAHQKLPNQKKLVKVKTKSAARVGTNAIKNFVVCTEDHKIWTEEKGWIEAGKLTPGLTVQIETAAQKNQAYKISSKGKKRLSQEMTTKNNTGITGTFKTEKGIWAGQRGGNGKNMSTPQQILFNELGENWKNEFSVKTTREQRAKYNCPNCYKIDIANPDKMIAVEVDGNGHKYRQLTDNKKDIVLAELGWKVYRYDNKQAIQSSREIACKLNETGCPALAVILSVEYTEIPDYYVYDITVEKCHNFYANGILVHNCQDLNKAQITFAENSMANDGRMLLIGDPHQSIYAFRGAFNGIMDYMQNRLNATVLPLSISYRAPQVIVSLVNTVFPHIVFEGSVTAKEGYVSNLQADDLTMVVDDGDAVICRTNAPLVKPAFQLLKEGRKAVILGRDIGQGLISLIDKRAKLIVVKTAVNPLAELLYQLQVYFENEKVKLERTKRFSKLQTLQDQIETIAAIADGCETIAELRTKIESIFSNNRSGVVFSSIHKAKGLEWENVFILKPEQMPHPMAKDPVQKVQETNIKYVAYTRSKCNLYLVQGVK